MIIINVNFLLLPRAVKLILVTESCPSGTTKTRSPAIAQIADRTALEILVAVSLRAQGPCKGLKVVPSCS